MILGNNFNHLDLERQLAAQREQEELQHRKKQIALAVLLGVLVAVVAVAVVLVVSSSNGAGNSSSTEISTPATSGGDDTSDKQAGSSGGTAAKKDTDNASADTTDAELESAIGDIGNSSEAKLGIYVAAADGSWEAGYNENRAQRSASMIKIAIMGALFQKIDDGDISLDDIHTVTSGEIVGGTGTIQNSGVGKSYTVRELVKRMISDSDNTATNIIIDMVGMKDVNSYAKEQGLTKTKLNRKMMDTDAPKENYTSARDLGVLFEQIAAGTFASKKLNTLALDALNAQSDSFGFAKGLPSGISFAHKTGTLTAARNDGGITQGVSDGEVVMVLLADETDEAEAQGVATKVAKAVTNQLGW